MDRGKFELKITGFGRHGCDRHTLEGEQLRTRCTRLTCVDCLAYDFVQELQQKGFRIEGATFTHHVGALNPGDVVVDDLRENKRQSGRF